MRADTHASYTQKPTHRYTLRTRARDVRMKRPVRTHDARVANRRAVPVPVAFVRLTVNRRMDVARASCDRTPRARRSTRERSSERERRVRFGSIDRSTDRSPTDRFGFGFDFHSFIRNDSRDEGREGTKGRIAWRRRWRRKRSRRWRSRAWRAETRYARCAREGDAGGGRERERERGARRRAWRLRSVGFKRMHARECMNEEREGWLTDGVNARRRETIGVRDVEDRWRPERGGTRDTHGRAGGVGGD